MQSTPMPVGARLFYLLLERIANRLQVGTLTAYLPNGETIKAVGALSETPVAEIYVRDYAFARRVIFGGDIGLYESFELGEWDTPDLTGCLHMLALNADYIADVFASSPVIALLESIRHQFNKNSVSGSKKNISAHYDLGNAFYEKWLDPSMTYSSALYMRQGESLTTAQENKYRNLAQSIGLKPDEKVLEIGCGWGGFAEFAAREVGAHVTGLTISQEQFDFSRRRIFEAGLNEKVDIQLTDYRDSEGKYDKVASIEMFEAVGKEYWPVYFSKVYNSLNPGGIAGLQVITIADRMYEHYSKYVDFIQKYVFPGGFLPSPKVLKEQVETAGLSWRNTTNFGLDYARTLSEWRDQFVLAWDEIVPLGFDERFNRLWRYYLSYCEAGFKAQSTDVYQVAIAKP